MCYRLTGDNYLSTIDSSEFFLFLARYKFVIAFENSACEDYVTEKLWRPLMVGVLPIYFGAPNIKVRHAIYIFDSHVVYNFKRNVILNCCDQSQQWLPHPNQSAILVSDFETPAHLAEFVRYLNDDDEAYTAYTSAAKNATNDFLRRSIAKRNERSSSSSIFQDFECSIASYAGDGLSIADSRHYNCFDSDQRYVATSEIPTDTTTSITPNKAYESWKPIWRQAACEAELLDELIRGNVSFTKNTFESKLIGKYIESKCDIYKYH